MYTPPETNPVNAGQPDFVINDEDKTLAVQAQHLILAAGTPYEAASMLNHYFQHPHLPAPPLYTFQISQELDSWFAILKSESLATLESITGNLVSLRAVLDSKDVHDFLVKIKILFDEYRHSLPSASHSKIHGGWKKRRPNNGLSEDTLDALTSRDLIAIIIIEVLFFNQLCRTEPPVDPTEKRRGTPIGLRIVREVNDDRQEGKLD
ncbi:uncharacterized protein KY384_003925 [Bacidia gigantensis]|uniref:uncharacterized protein n=1 Tax=Bacidia gigantensis TaxID=2732470 RepID=UPI001D048D5E|nr:uncharacterized protein KY384_003925 [Bacidia gigantensis]KAG8532284.1 hypothetical protein KY384_003925 [Bacidia gigantensis]